MATGGAVSDLNRFGGVVDKVSAQAIRDLDHIDAAMKGVGGMAGPSAEMVRFAEQASRSAISAVRDRNAVEKAGETLIRQPRSGSRALGKSKARCRPQR